MEIPFLELDPDRLQRLLPVIYAAGLTAWGLILMLFGYRLYRLLATLTGIAAGIVTAVTLSAEFLPEHPLLYYFLALLGAGAGGAVFYYVSIFLLGAVLGASVAHLLGWGWLVSQGYEPSGAAAQGMVASYAVAGLTAGALALLFKRPFLVAITSVGGASYSILGAAMAAGGLACFAQGDTVFVWILAGLTFIALTITGVTVQLKVTGRQGEEPTRKPAGESDGNKKGEKPSAA